MMCGWIIGTGHAWCIVRLTKVDLNITLIIDALKNYRVAG
jgi:hypothetical protein